MKVIDDYIYIRKIELKAESKIIKRNRNDKEVDKKIWRVLKCKEIVALRESLFSQIIRIWKLLFPSLGIYFSGKFLCLQREAALPFSRNKFLLSIAASLVGKTGFSITHGSIINLERTIIFCLVAD